MLLPLQWLVGVFGIPQLPGNGLNPMSTTTKRTELLQQQVERRRYETMQAAAERTSLSVRSIRRYIAEGRLTGYRVGQRTIRLDPDEVDALFTPTTKWSEVA